MEITERQKQIQSASKQTEIGTIPIDWDVKHLFEIADVVRGGSPRPAGDPRYFNGNFIPWLTVAALTNIPTSEIYVSETLGYLTEEGSRHSRTLEIDTLIIANSGATLGVAKILKIKCCANDGIAALINVKDFDKQFICQYLNTRTKWLREVVAPGNGQPNLNTGLIGQISVPFPDPPEQSTIAAVLSRVDTLIASLDSLVAKKRDIKRAAMQQLLSGRQRLPEFNGEWELKRFGEIAKPRKDRVDPRRAGAQEFCVEMEHIEQGSGQLVGSTRAGDQSSIKSIFHVGDVLFGKLRAYLRKYWLADREGVCSTEFWVLVANRRVVTPEFLFQLVTVDQFIETASSAYGTHMPRSDWNVVKNYELAIPKPEEQAAIAAVLWNIDADVAALEARRDKARALKQGMMQQLLTGNIRLI